MFSLGMVKATEQKRTTGKNKKDHWDSEKLHQPSNYIMWYQD